MSARLHVVLSDEEHARFKACAEAEGVSFSTWVRMALALAEQGRGRKTPQERMAAVRHAMAIPDEQRVPTPSIEELRRGYERKYEDA